MRQVLLETTQHHSTMHVNVRGVKDPDTGKEIWINVSDFKKTKEVRGRQQDYVGWIMNATLSELDGGEKVMRYFVRCSNLFSKLAAGRNQGALDGIINNSALALSYAQILAVMQEPRLPYLVRARYAMLMSRLYVDRDPQAPSPYVSYTRVWSKVTPQVSDLDVSSANVNQVVAKIPVCTTGFKDLEAFLLNELPKMADCSDPSGKPSLNGTPRIGQLELLTSLVAITDQLVEFGFFVPPHAPAQEPDFSR